MPERTATPSSTASNYVQVTPSSDPIDLSACRGQLKRLHATDATIECLLVSPAAGTVEYYLGADGHQDRLTTALQTMTPDSYDIVPASDPIPDIDDDTATGLRFVGRGRRRRDWQTPLDRAPTDGAWTPQPLADVAHAMATTETPVVYQALLTPTPDWSMAARDRQLDLDMNGDTLTGKLFGSPEHEPARENTQRIDAIDSMDPQRCFTVTARAVAWGSTPGPTLDAIGDVFVPIDGRFYGVRATTVDADGNAAFRSRLASAATAGGPSLTRRLLNRVPWLAERRPDIVADYRAVPHFVLFDDRGFTTDAKRALDATPSERTGMALPDGDTLETYTDGGFTLGTPLTNDREPTAETLALPPALQPLHTARFGTSGSGKTVAGIRALLDNHAATDGPTIIIDQKGDQSMCAAYLNAHQTRYGDCEDVHYFDCTDTVPALSFFDVTDPGDRPRAAAVQDVTEHYLEILAALMGRDRFEQAVRAPDVIRYLVRALFDPVYGADRFGHRDLLAAVDDLATSHDPPPVSDGTLQANLEGVTTLPDRTFGNLIAGVRTRVEKITTDDRIAALFEADPGPDPDTDADGGSPPRFKFRDHLEADQVLLFDLGGLRQESRHAVALTLLSQLWTGLKARARQREATDRLVNLHVEEAGAVAGTEVLRDLLRESRSYGVAVSLSMQFPEQLEAADPEAYQELIHDVSTVVAGPGAGDRDLVERLATDATPPREMRNAIDGLGRGEWLVDLPEAFGEAPPRPFRIESPTPAPGTAAHPSTDAPSDDSLRARVADRTRERYGRTVTDPSTTSQASTPNATGTRRLTSTLPFTSRMPDCVTHDPAANGLVCDTCEKRYEPSDAGMTRAIACCHDPAAVDRDDVPITRTPLTLSPAEVARSSYTDRQLCFLQAVHDATNRRHDPDLAYDLTRDSMLRLQEYVGVSDDGIEDLEADGLLRHDHDMPHRLYTVTPDGRREIRAAHRDGVTFGDGAGDLNESSLHVVMVDAGHELLETRYVADPASPVTEAVRYHDVGDHRLDVAGLDADGDVVVGVEAERDNNDYKRSIPADYDAMAAHDPAHALWIVENVDGAHALLAALTDPADGEARLSKSYSRNTRPQQWQLDAPGCTDVFPLQYLRTEVLEYNA